MKRSLLAILLAFAFALPAFEPTVFADGTPARDQLFALEADLTVAAGASEIAALDLPAEVVTRTKADLSDLRVFDAAGREVPFVLDRSDRQRVRTVKQRIDAAVERVERARVSEAGAVAGKQASVTENYVLQIPAEVSAGGPWELVITSARPNYVRTVVLETLDGDQVTGTVAEGSIHRLSGGGVVRDRLSARALFGKTGLLRVTFTGNDSNYLEPTFAFESTETLVSNAELAVPLAITGTESEGGVTRVTLKRPGGLVPSAIRVVPSDGFFDRSVSVLQGSPSGDFTPVGAGRILRVPDSSQEVLDVPVGPAHGDVLRVDIHDLDSPAFSGTQFFGVIDQPRIVFAAPREGATYALMFGGGRAKRPDYDVARLLKLPTSGADATVTAALLDPDRVRVVTVGSVRANPRFDSSRVLLADLLKPGAPVNDQFYEYVAPFFVPESTTGLHVLTLTPADVARSEVSGFGDLRIVDSASQQWPYVLDTDIADAWSTVGYVPEKAPGGVTKYAVDFGETFGGPVQATGVRLKIQDSLFDRPVVVTGESPEGKRVSLLVETLRRTEKDSVDVFHSQPFAGTRLSKLTIEVTDGNNAPLSIQQIDVRIPVPVVTFVAKRGEHRVLLGNPKDKAPSYDLARMTALLRDTAADEIKAGALFENPRYNARARFLSGERKDNLLLWLVLGAAVLVLVGFTLRLARTTPEAKPADANPPPGDSAV